MVRQRSLWHGWNETAAAATRALREARTTLFAFDWDRGRFSVPVAVLRQMAKGTGGTYRSVRQPDWKAAVDALVNETRGYHIISFRLERLPRRPGTLPLTVELVGRDGKILAPSFEIVRVRR